MDDKLARRFLDELTKLRKAQERTADALEVANTLNPLGMIQEALEGGGAPSGAQEGTTAYVKRIPDEWIEDRDPLPPLTPEQQAYVESLR